MTAEQFLFIQAIDTFKRVNGKTFPTWTDVLEVIRKLGYRKTMASELTLGQHCEDWTEDASWAQRSRYGIRRSCLTCALAAQQGSFSWRTNRR